MFNESSPKRLISQPVNCKTVSLFVCALTLHWTAVSCEVDCSSGCLVFESHACHSGFALANAQHTSDLTSAEPHSSDYICLERLSNRPPSNTVAVPNFALEESAVDKSESDDSNTTNGGAKRSDNSREDWASRTGLTRVVRMWEAILLSALLPLCLLLTVWLSRVTVLWLSARQSPNEDMHQHSGGCKLMECVLCCFGVDSALRRHSWSMTPSSPSAFAARTQMSATGLISMAATTTHHTAIGLQHSDKSAKNDDSDSDMVDVRRVDAAAIGGAKAKPSPIGHSHDDVVALEEVVIHTSDILQRTDSLSLHASANDATIVVKKKKKKKKSKNGRSVGVIKEKKDRFVSGLTSVSLPAIHRRQPRLRSSDRFERRFSNGHDLREWASPVPWSPPLNCEETATITSSRATHGRASTTPLLATMTSTIRRKGSGTRLVECAVDSSDSVGNRSSTEKSVAGTYTPTAASRTPPPPRRGGFKPGLLVLSATNATVGSIESPTLSSALTVTVEDTHTTERLLEGSSSELLFAAVGRTDLSQLFDGTRFERLPLAPLTQERAPLKKHECTNSETVIVMDDSLVTSSSTTLPSGRKRSVCLPPEEEEEVDCELHEEEEEHGSGSVVSAQSGSSSDRRIKLEMGFLEQLPKLQPMVTATTATTDDSEGSINANAMQRVDKHLLAEKKKDKDTDDGKAESAEVTPEIVYLGDSELVDDSASVTPFPSPPETVEKSDALSTTTTDSLAEDMLHSISESNSSSGIGLTIGIGSRMRKHDDDAKKKETLPSALLPVPRPKKKRGGGGHSSSRKSHRRKTSNVSTVSTESTISKLSVFSTMTGASGLKATDSGKKGTKSKGQRSGGRLQVLVDRLSDERRGSERLSLLSAASVSVVSKGRHGDDGIVEGLGKCRDEPIEFNPPPLGLGGHCSLSTTPRSPSVPICSSADSISDPNALGDKRLPWYQQLHPALHPHFDELIDFHNEGDDAKMPPRKKVPTPVGGKRTIRRKRASDQHSAASSSSRRGHVPHGYRDRHAQQSSHRHSHGQKNFDGRLRRSYGGHARGHRKGKGGSILKPKKRDSLKRAKRRRYSKSKSSSAQNEKRKSLSAKRKSLSRRLSAKRRKKKKAKSAHADDWGMSQSPPLKLETPSFSSSDEKTVPRKKRPSLAQTILSGLKRSKTEVSDVKRRTPERRCKRRKSRERHSDV